MQAITCLFSKSLFPWRLCQRYVRSNFIFTHDVCSSKHKDEGSFLIWCPFLARYCCLGRAQTSWFSWTQGCKHGPPSSKYYSNFSLKVDNNRCYWIWTGTKSTNFLRIFRFSFGLAGNPLGAHSTLCTVFFCMLGIRGTYPIHKVQVAVLVQIVFLMWKACCFF